MPIRALFVGMMPNKVQGQFAITKTAPAAFAVGLPPTRPDKPFARVSSV
jgi:hypothetical protein